MDRLPSADCGGRTRSRCARSRASPLPCGPRGSRTPRVRSVTAPRPRARAGRPRAVPAAGHERTRRATRIRGSRSRSSPLRPRSPPTRPILGSGQRLADPSARMEAYASLRNLVNVERRARSPLCAGEPSFGRAPRRARGRVPAEARGVTSTHPRAPALSARRAVGSKSASRADASRASRQPGRCVQPRLHLPEGRNAVFSGIAVVAPA